VEKDAVFFSESVFLPLKKKRHSMSPDPGKEYTVKCALKRAVPDLHHLEDIREAVLRTNQCTYLATELVNLYVRDRIENHDATALEKVFDRNWLIKAYYAVSEGSKATLPH
jgi:hypothetical protein